jgi:hypothetical protein
MPWDDLSESDLMHISMHMRSFQDENNAKQAREKAANTRENWVIASVVFQFVALGIAGVSAWLFLAIMIPAILSWIVVDQNK